MKTVFPFLLPFIAAALGWAANRLIVKALFRPLKPVKILGITIQGIFPKRQKEIAVKLGAAVANNLFDIRNLTVQMTDPALLAGLMPDIEKHIDVFLKERLKEKMPALAMFMSDAVIETVRNGLVDEISVMLPGVLTQYAGALEKKIDIGQAVSDKIAALSMDRVEQQLQSAMGGALRTFEWTGAVVGFVIGLLQLLFTRL